MTRTATPRPRADAPAQTTGTVVMIRPRHFFSNPDTATSNEFQRTATAPEFARALEEFEGLRKTLLGHGVRVITFDAGSDPVTPDAIFPNNWLSTHADGTVVTYPMQPASRRPERRADIVASLATEHGFCVRRQLDLSDLERDGQFVEGTGSLVLDRTFRRAFACLSARTHRDAVARFADEMHYEPITFAAFGPGGTPVYHTNVMMCVGRGFIVACLEAIDPVDRERVAAAMRRDHELIEITMTQMSAFAGNMLELRNGDGQPLLAMSERALQSLSVAQRERLGAHARLVSASIPTIEDAAGGSVRCMLAEVFLPEEAQD